MWSWSTCRSRGVPMPPENLLELIQKRPFTPFRIYLTDGTMYEIRHPELVMPGKRAVIVGLPADPAEPLFVRSVIVALLHVVRLEPLDTPTAGAAERVA